eukprot:comp129719_c0_seq1/m.49114 comp129719_c0_seq1/g.49114  ORF comp129719_c0_seq1/g.49114 comp129719_c0_seq1/m.49114 type:complete len:156 (-) comp129719_c0_seq1:597-1064(-)
MRVDVLELLERAACAGSKPSPVHTHRIGFAVRRLGLKLTAWMDRAKNSNMGTGLVFAAVIAVSSFMVHPGSIISPQAKTVLMASMSMLMWALLCGSVVFLGESKPTAGQIISQLLIVPLWRLGCLQPLLAAIVVVAMLVVPPYCMTVTVGGMFVG